MITKNKVISASTKRIETKLRALSAEKKEYEQLIDQAHDIIKNIDVEIDTLLKELNVKKNEADNKVKPINGIIKLCYPNEESVVAVLNRENNTLKLITPIDGKTMTLQKRYTEFFKTYDIDIDIKGEQNKKTKEKEFCRYIIQDGKRIEFNNNELNISLQ